MKRTIIITALVVILASVGLTVFVNLTSGRGNEMMNFADAKRGNFEISVSNTGELVAENSIDIKGPNIVINRNFRAAAIKILDLVPEGTLVKKGDYIANLDRTNFNNTLKSEIEMLNTNQAALEMKILDTSIVLSTLRDEIKNQQFVVEEASVTVDQSRFEPPAVQRQAALKLDKEIRLYTQKQKNYSLRSKQNLSEIRTLMQITENQKKKVADYQAILEQFTITAPSDGMVIYRKDRMGNKVKAGTILNPFDPVVATLPDLSSMLSKIYVSEIYINKVMKGQPVNITVDAFPGKSFKGEVMQIANIGEQLSNSDSKVFEVLVKLDDFYPGLRPAMTTSNKVVTSLFSDVVYIPEECLHTGIDSIPFVYTKDGTRQVVVPGASNEKNIIIERGLDAETLVWLGTPEKAEKFSIAGSELIPLIKDRERARRLEMKIRRDDKILLSKSEKDKLINSSPSGVASGSSTSPGVN